MMQNSKNSGLAHRAKATLLKLLATHHETSGIGQDYYCQENRYHPMAEGKYLLALAECCRAGIIGEDTFRKQASAATARLMADANQDSRTTGDIAFGLNFAYKQSDTCDRYLITTAIVAHGLLESRDLLTSLPHDEQLLEGITIWLNALSRVSSTNDPGCTSPNCALRYSEQLDTRIFNANAYAARIVHSLKAAGFPITISPDPIINWLERGFVPRIGWPYNEGSTRFDLLHECYIMNSLSILLPNLENDAFAVLCAFIQNTGVVDAFDTVSFEEAMVRVAKASRTTLRFDGRVVLVYTDKPARLWSVGEALVLASFYCRHGSYRSAWKNMLARLASFALSTCDSYPSHYLRESMHLAHGLASFLRCMRRASHYWT